MSYCQYSNLHWYSLSPNIELVVDSWRLSPHFWRFIFGIRGVAEILLRVDFHIGVLSTATTITLIE